VEYALKDSEKPIGVATYRVVSTLPVELEGELPAPEQIAKLLESIMKKRISQTSRRFITLWLMTIAVVVAIAPSVNAHANYQETQNPVNAIVGLTDTLAQIRVFNSFNSNLTNFFQGEGLKLVLIALLKAGTATVILYRTYLRSLQWRIKALTVL
jgi:hypothetical protein